MTFPEKMAVLSALSAAIAASALASRPRRSAVGRLGIALPLVVIAIALLAVGLVSGTVAVHLIQIAPLAIALWFINSRSRWASAAALPLFAFWLLVMGGIWLFLLGVARIFTGTFSPAEIVLTFIIGIGAIAGLVTGYVCRSTPAAPADYATAVVFSAVQGAAVWFTYSPYMPR